MKWCRVAIIKKRIDDIRKTFEIFSSYISDLEKQKSTNFKLIFFQGMSNRFGHCWHEPTVICTLYDVEPNEVLIIEVKKPFSEFCNKIHTEIGFTYLNIENVSCGADVYEIGSYSLSKELKINNHLLIISNKFFEVFYNSIIGSRHGLKTYIKSSIFKKFKNSVFNKYKILNNRSIVVLHVRDSGWFGSGYHDYRDADIKTYVPTVKYLLSLNYVVVRIGDKSMPKFPYSDNNLVDLPHLSSFQDGDDVTITAFCDFYVGQNTGPIALPMFFNKDIVLTNEPNPFIGWPIDGDNKKSKMIVLFKTRLNKISKKKIPIGDFLTGQHLFKKSDFDNLGIILVENTCEEIKNSVQEMMNLRKTKFNTKTTYRINKELNFIWTLRQISGSDNFNLGRPGEGDLVSKQHLSSNIKTPLNFSQSEIVLGKGIPKNKVIMLKWIIFDALKTFLITLKLVKQTKENLGIKSTFFKITKKLLMKYLK